MMRTLIAGLVAVAFIAGGSAPIQEDDPGWDCQTMGNQVCGELLPDGSRILTYYGEDEPPWLTGEM